METGDKELVWLEREVKSPPFSSAARRCHELRIADEDKTWRIVYRINYDAILILEVFAKKDRTTPRHIIESCRKRIKAYDAL